MGVQEQFLYTIKDEFSGYSDPVMIANDDLAKRYMNLKTTEIALMRNNPKDFSLWKIGKFDILNGTLETLKPELIMRGEYHAPVCPYREER